MTHDVTAGVAALRDWGRWYQRCIDFGMNLPDPVVLVGALNSMTKPVISKDTEVTWRTEMVKSTLQLHARPTAEAVTASTGICWPSSRHWPRPRFPKRVAINLPTLP